MAAIIILIIAVCAAIIFVTSRKSSEQAAPAAPLVELLPTGEDGVDKLCRELWRKEDYQGAAEVILGRIATMDDTEPTPEELARLRLLRRNELLCEVIDEAASVDADMDVELQGLDPDDHACRYCDDVKRMPLRAYLLAPDALLCESCTAKERKFFCGVNLRPL